MSSWTVLLAAVGMAMFLEGLPYFVSPAAVRGYLAVIAEMSDAGLRRAGLTLMTAGLLVVYFATR